MRYYINHLLERAGSADGVELINVRIAGLPISVVSVWFHAGSRFDPSGKEGLAHLLEHALFTHTEAHTDPIARMKALESMGISANAYTSLETSHFYHVGPADKTYESLDMLWEAASALLPNEEILTREKQAIHHEARQHRAVPRERIWNISNQDLWKESSLGRDFFGTPQSVASIAMKDVQQFVYTHYKPKCAVVVVGDTQTQALATRIGHSARVSVARNKEEVSSVVKTPNGVVSVTEDGDQATVAVAFETLPWGNIADMATMDFIRDYMANRWSSRLVESLRIKRNIAYWVDADTSYFSDTGLLRFVFSCDREHVDESLAVVREELERLLRGEIPKADMDACRASMSSGLIVRFADAYEYAWWYGWQVTVAPKLPLIRIDAYADALKDVDREDIRRMTERYLDWTFVKKS